MYTRICIYFIHTYDDAYAYMHVYLCVSVYVYIC